MGLEFSNFNLSSTASLMKTNSTQHLTMETVTMNSITSSQSTESNSILIDLMDIGPQLNVNISLSNISVEKSNLIVFGVDLPNLSSTLSKSIQIKNLTVQDCIFDNWMDMIHIYALKSKDEFLLNFDSLVFQNLSFTRGGYLLNLQHQAPNNLTWTNSVIQKVTKGSLSIGGYDLKSTINHDAKVEILNLTVTDVDAFADSFIEVKEGGMLKIFSSEFSFISNIIIGAVLKATSGSRVEIYSSNFYNNTSIEGGVFLSEDGASIKAYYCSFFNNFAINSAVIK